MAGSAAAVTAALRGELLLIFIYLLFFLWLAFLTGGFSVQPPRPSSNRRQRRLSPRFAAWKRCAGYKGRFQICRAGQRRPAP